MAAEIDFASIAEYLQHPLVLTGFGLFLLFGLFRAILNSGLLKQVTKDTSGVLLGQIIRYGFALAVLLMALGFGLQLFQVEGLSYAWTLALILMVLVFALLFFRTDRDAESAERRAALAEKARVEAMDMARQALKTTENIAAGSEISAETLAQITEAVEALAAEDRPGVDDALAQLAQRKTSEAKAIFRDVVETRIGEISEAAAALRHLGALAFLDDTQEALDVYQRATGLEPGNSVGWNQIGILYMRTGKLTKAEQAFERVIEIGGSAGEPQWSASAYGNLGNVYQIRGDLDEAEAMYRKALEIHEALGIKSGMASAYGNLGLVYQIGGELKQAETMHQQALEINKTLGDMEGMANQYRNLGVLYKTRGELDQAEAMHRKALEIHEALGIKSGMASDYGNLGVVYRNCGELDQAEAMFQQALEMSKELGDEGGVANSYANLGNVYAMRGKLDQAEKVYKKALAIDSEIGRKKEMAIVYANLGSLYEERGDLDEARESWQRSLTLFEELNSQRAGEIRQWLADLD